METQPWVLTYIVGMGFWLWVVRWGGAERLAGTWRGMMILGSASSDHAEAIKLAGWVCMFGITVWFVVGLVYPELRAVPWGFWL